MLFRYKYISNLQIDALRFIFVFSLSVSILIPCIALFLLVFGNIFRCVYGREFLFSDASFEVSAQLVPDGLGAFVTTIFNLKRELRFRHSIYDNPNCPVQIANWLSKRS